MDLANTQRIDRKNLVRQEIETAIDLAFSGGSAIVINLLAWAAYDVVRGVAKAKGITLLMDELDAMIRPEKLDEWYRALKADYNFSKHADRDPDRELPDFNPEAANFALFQVCVDYQRTFGKQSIPMALMVSWTFARVPQILADSSAMHSVTRHFGAGAPIEHAAALYRVWKENRDSFVKDLGFDLPDNFEL